MIVMKKNQSYMSKGSVQKGFSLIELMITMMIGLFLLVGIATSFMASKKGNSDRNQLSVLEDNGRMALEIISNSIERAGYTPISNANPLSQSIVTNAATISAENCTSSVENITDVDIFTDARLTQDNDGGDSLAIVHYGDSKVFTDCGANILPVACRVTTGATSLASEASLIYSAFFLEGGNLYCAGSRGDSVQAISYGVENIQFLYGIRSGTNNFVDRYLNATNMAGQWHNVISVQVAILVRSQNVVKPVSEQQSFSLLDQNVTAPNDRYLRAVFSKTVRLRNNTL